MAAAVNYSNQHTTPHTHLVLPPAKSKSARDPVKSTNVRTHAHSTRALNWRESMCERVCERECVSVFVGVRVHMFVCVCRLCVWRMGLCACVSE